MLRRRLDRRKWERSQSREVPNRHRERGISLDKPANQIEGADPHPITHFTSISGDGKPNNHDKCDCSRNGNKKLMECLAFGVAVFACLGTIWQAYVANDTESQTLRAYLGPENASFHLACIHCTKQPDGTVLGANEIDYTVKNYGSTPAYTPVSCGWSAAPIYKGPLAREDVAQAVSFCNNPKNQVIQSTIWPQEPVSYVRQIPDASYILNVRSHAARLLVLGRLKYRDAFGRPRETWFCKEYIYDGDDIFIGCQGDNIPPDK
jgi:hypothetical protein